MCTVSKCFKHVLFFFSFYDNHLLTSSVSNKQGHSNSKLESQSDTESSMTTDSDIDDGLCSAALLCGPPGVGKTAAVYACAQELGYKVKGSVWAAAVECATRFID